VGARKGGDDGLGFTDPVQEGSMHTGSVRVVRASGELDGRMRGSGSKTSADVDGRGSSTAPNGTREGPDSLFTVDRREPFTQEPVGAPDRGAQLAIATNGAMWCINNQATVFLGTQTTSPRTRHQKKRTVRASAAARTIDWSPNRSRL
jgi:hypothetical protein